MTDSTQYPDFDQLWDYNQPAETEQAFRALLPQAQDNPAYHAELLTQLARTQGLQRKFEAAHTILDEVELVLTPEMSRVQIRYWLERGRTFNSSGQPEKAGPLFLQAWALGTTTGEDFHAIDAAHMMAIVEPLEAQLPWNLKALALTEKTDDQRAKKWLGSLNNNIGWTFFDQEKYEQALAHFYKSLAYQESVGNTEQIQIGQWCVARGLRALGQVDEALGIQQNLLQDHEANGTQDGYVYEELGECLLSLDKPDEAQPYFALAYDLLSQDEWLMVNEAARMARLKALKEQTST